MNFQSCKKLDDVAALGHGLRELMALQQLEMDFGKCSQLADVAALGDGLRELTGLRRLTRERYNHPINSSARHAIKKYGNSCAGKMTYRVG